MTESVDYVNYLTKAVVPKEAMSFAARRVIGPPPKLHKAFASTGAVCTAAAASIQGTVVQAITADISSGVVRIGHPTGVFPVQLRLDAEGQLLEASYSRTARRLLEGQAYIHSRILAGQ